jgi:uncharacterized protein YejL (UPF0352 family)
MSQWSTLEPVDHYMNEILEGLAFADIPDLVRIVASYLDQHVRRWVLEIIPVTAEHLMVTDLPTVLCNLILTILGVSVRDYILFAKVVAGHLQCILESPVSLQETGTVTNLPWVPSWSVGDIIHHELGSFICSVPGY